MKVINVIFGLLQIVTIESGCFAEETDPFQIRLVGGSNDAEGRVEVFKNGSWNTICDFSWDLLAARVACRQLGFDGAVSAPRGARFGLGSGPILEVECDGGESSLEECNMMHKRQSNCWHGKDASAICYSGEPFQVRLVGGSSDAEGRVEVFYKGYWGNIFDQYWYLNDAKVVCRMLGFDGAVRAPRSASYGRGSGPTLLIRVDCTGHEKSLAECKHSGIANYSRPGRVACAVCYSGDPFQVRLVGGSNDAEGRVELFYNGSWGTICGKMWDIRDAGVACRMLGYEGALAGPGSARFGEGAGPISLHGVLCNGHQSSLAECDHFGLEDYSSCGHGRDAGAICYSGAPFRVRLDNGSKGRVEVFYNGSWGTICEDAWGLLDARVVCRMLGYDGAVAAPRYARSAEGSGPTILNWVQCDGSEISLAECSHTGIWDQTVCNDRVAGAVCFSGDPFQVRLVGGSNDAEGTVEVFYDGSWGTICDNGWVMTDATVACRMLGFDGALAAPRSARFGKGSGPIFLTRFHCNGRESSLAECKHFGIGNYSSCGHGSDAGVVCYSGDPFEVRLVGGSNEAEGRVEVFYNGSWGTICDEYWDLMDAKVVCRILGFDGALRAPRSASFGEGSGPIILKSMRCDGNEGSLAECKHRAIGNDSACDHSRDAGDICYSGEPFAVRLVNGSNDAEGRVEVFRGGTWGTICSYAWDLSDAEVICRMLGFNGALGAPRHAKFGEGSGHILLNTVRCSGSESSLAECPHEGIGEYSYCGHGLDAGAECYSRDPFQVRLVNGSTDTEGRVEISVNNGSWGTICDERWDLLDARIVCRMLEFDGALDAPKGARFGEGSGPILFSRVQCDGIEMSLAECFHTGVGRYSSCGHEKDVSAICYSGDPFQVRLVNGSNNAEGRVEIFYDGSWGTISDRGWDVDDATVVCRMLGFDGALAAPISASYGEGSGLVLMNDVMCSGSESNLSECNHAGIGDFSSRGHGRDAGAVCYYGDPFRVRLVDGSKETEGRVEISLNDGSWGTICDERWGFEDARVVCQMLGFDGALAAPRASRFGEGSGPILLNQVRCSEGGSSLVQCNLGKLGDFRSCGHGRDASATCYSGNPFQVRLVNGSNDAEGRVEVFYNGAWGTICDSQWSPPDARVVCRMMGFDGGSAALVRSAYGEGTGAVLLNGVRCDGNERSLAECSHDGIGDYTSCGHGRNAGAICYSEVYTTFAQPITTSLENSTTDFSTPNELNIGLVLGLIIPIPCIIAIATFVVCMCRFRKRYKKSSARNEHNDLKLITSSSSKSSHPESTYQQLHAPPRLPARDGTAESSQDNRTPAICMNTDIEQEYASIESNGEDEDGYLVANVASEGPYDDTIVTENEPDHNRNEGTEAESGARDQEITRIEVSTGSVSMKTIGYDYYTDIQLHDGDEEDRDGYLVPITPSPESDDYKAVLED